jgi:hypothetical protein
MAKIVSAEEKNSNATAALGLSALVDGSTRIHHREMDCCVTACSVRPVSGPPRVGTES